VTLLRAAWNRTRLAVRGLTAAYDAIDLLILAGTVLGVLVAPAAALARWLAS